MHEFFRSWQRKAGCVTLVIACAFASAWVRSSFLVDDVSFTQGRDGYKVTSFHGVIHLLWYSRKNASPYFEFGWESHAMGHRHSTITRDQEFHWDRDFKAAPYWSIVIPLTLISAYLLFSKTGPMKHSAESNGRLAKPAENF